MTPGAIAADVRSARSLGNGYRRSVIRSPAKELFDLREILRFASGGSE